MLKLQEKFNKTAGEGFTAQEVHLIRAMAKFTLSEVKRQLVKSIEHHVATNDFMSSQKVFMGGVYEKFHKYYVSKYPTLTLEEVKEKYSEVAYIVTGGDSGEIIDYDIENGEPIFSDDEDTIHITHLNDPIHIGKYLALSKEPTTFINDYNLLYYLETETRIKPVSKQQRGFEYEVTDELLKHMFRDEVMLIVPAVVNEGKCKTAKEILSSETATARGEIGTMKLHGYRNENICGDDWTTLASKGVICGGFGFVPVHESLFTKGG